jgi:hypothetical protein
MNATQEHDSGRVPELASEGSTLGLHSADLRQLMMKDEGEKLILDRVSKKRGNCEGQARSG